MRWTGFSGAEIRGFLGDPTKLVMKPEKPDFFLRTAEGLASLASSEYRLGGTVLLSTLDSDLSSLLTMVSALESAAVKLADWRSGGGGGGGMALVAASSAPTSGGAGAGRGGGGR